MLSSISASFCSEKVVAVAAEAPSSISGVNWPLCIQRVEDRLASSASSEVVRVVAGFAPERVEVRAAREPRLQQEVGQVVEQRPGGQPRLPSRG